MKNDFNLDKGHGDPVRKLEDKELKTFIEEDACHNFIGNDNRNEQISTVIVFIVLIKWNEY